MRRLVLWLSLLATICPALAEEAPIGRVKSAAGEAVIVSDGTTARAAVGMPVFRGSVIRTGRDGSVGVTFRDETLVAVGPGSQLSLDGYDYAPARRRASFASTLLKGTLVYLSGAIAKLRPESVLLRTPTATVGIRGTQFAIKVGERPTVPSGDAS